MRGLKSVGTRLARVRFVTLMSVSVAVAAGFWFRAFNEPPPPAGVVIITLDTTRADRLPVYGFMDAAMPHLERLAREGVVFDQATSVAPLTLPAHCSLFTGLFPPGHGVRDNADRPLSPDQTTLAEILRVRGFRTAAFVGSVVLAPDRGLAQGFDQYGGVSNTRAPGRATAPRRRADDVIDDAIRWIDGVGQSRFFVWAHLYDAHRPYDPPEPFRSKYYDPYIAELVFADSQVGRLVEALESRKLLDRTLVVVVGDHGESLGDHGERDHGIFVYESVLHVPLIVRSPNLRPARIPDVVRLVDVMPTVLDLLGMAQPRVDGVSLAGLVRGRPLPAELDAYSESEYPLRFGWSPLRALRAGRYKLIDAPSPELYDLDRDPFEERNIYGERGDISRALAGRLATFERILPAKPRGDRDAVLDDEVQQRLSSLGYIGSGALPNASDPHSLPDPKDCIGRLKSGGGTRP